MSPKPLAEHLDICDKCDKGVTIAGYYNGVESLVLCEGEGCWRARCLACAKLKVVPEGEWHCSTCATAIVERTLKLNESFIAAFRAAMNS